MYVVILRLLLVLIYADIPTIFSRVNRLSTIGSKHSYISLRQVTTVSPTHRNHIHIAARDSCWVDTLLPVNKAQEHNFILILKAVLATSLGSREFDTKNNPAQRRPGVFII